MKRRGRLDRRAFLRGVGATPLAWWLTSFERSAEGAEPPQRFMLILRPNGTIRADWMPTAAAGTTFTLPAISSAFEPLRSSMVLFDGINLVNSNGGAATHEGGMNTLLTGSPVNGVRPQPNDWKNTAASVDQILLTRSPNFMGRQALYIAADGRVDNSMPQVANRAIAYTGPDRPIYPELKPTLVYSRIFSQLVPGGQTDLLRARARRQSVLDFIKADLTNVSLLAPASQRPRLDQHAAVIRDLEQMLDATTPPVSACTQPTRPTDLAANVDANIGPIGMQHLALVQAAFACDLTRLVFFMWNAAASSAVWENLYAGMPRYNHHALSHLDLTSATVSRPLAAIDRWFADRTASFLTNLKGTPDGTGTLLDSTLVLYASEVADGTHAYKNIPLALFGGPGVHLQGGRLMKLANRSMNDLWLSIAGNFGVPLTALGAPEQYTGPIAGVFA